MPENAWKSFVAVWAKKACTVGTALALNTGSSSMPISRVAKTSIWRW